MREIVKMEKTLSDEIHESKKPKEKGLCNYPSFYWATNVKKHLQEFKEETERWFVQGHVYDADYIKNLIDTQMQKHFGDKLIGG